MKATIKDIAIACGISKTTVSRYINHSGYVSKELAEKIEKKIDQLNYIPSATARSLSTKQSDVIAVVVPEASNPFFGQVFKGISQVANQHNLSIFYYNTDNDSEKEVKAFETLRRYNIKGLILTPATDGIGCDTFEESVKALKVPLVLLDRDVDYVNWDGVFIDNYKGAFDCTKLLIDQGHKKIATICGDQKLQIGKERLHGYKEALKQAGEGRLDEFILEGDFTTETAYKLTKDLLKTHEQVSAIFAPNNLTTLGVLKALNEANLKVPKDIALVGFDDIDILNVLNIHVSVARRDTIDMGRQAMELLLKKIKSKDRKRVERRILKAEIISRGSEVKMN